MKIEYTVRKYIGGIFIKKPLIILTPSHDDGEEKTYLRFAYTDAIISAGGGPLAIGLCENDAYIYDMLSVADGLFLTGGDDIATELYGEKRTEKCGPVSLLRDRFEIRALHIAIKLGLPVLGVCRGAQVMNVALGGTLYEDMSGHRQTLPRHLPSHTVTVSGALGGIYPQTAKVNSFHHQAINNVSPKLEICAVSDDGYTEAVYMPHHPFFVGVQWHPEHMIKSDISAKRLFREFINECVKYKGEKQNDQGAST